MRSDLLALFLTHAFYAADWLQPASIFLNFQEHSAYVTLSSYVVRTTRRSTTSARLVRSYDAGLRGREYDDMYRRRGIVATTQTARVTL